MVFKGSGCSGLCTFKCVLIFHRTAGSVLGSGLQAFITDRDKVAAAVCCVPLLYLLANNAHFLARYRNAMTFIKFSIDPGSRFNHGSSGDIRRQAQYGSSSTLHRGPPWKAFTGQGNLETDGRGGHQTPDKGTVERSENLYCRALLTYL